MFSKAGKNKRLPAFSMMEAIVGMAVTAIIMGIIFIIFSIVSERLLEYKNQNQVVADLNRLTFSINKDIFENQQMDASETAVEFLGYSGQRVKYDFIEDYILRRSETFTDTFRIGLQSVRIDSVKSTAKRMVFRKVALKVSVRGKETNLNFYKQVYPDQLIKVK